ncbi:MAG: hypothetical protein ACHQIM_16495, partial [Sphingobacteriales bacterium]
MNNFIQRIGVLACIIIGLNGQLFAQTTCGGALNQCVTSQWNITAPIVAQAMPCTCCTTNPCTNPQFVNSGCLLSGGPNATWLIITIQTSGNLGWNVGSNASGFPQLGFYDWSMYPYTATTCAQIAANNLVPVACCWNGTSVGGTGMGPIPAGGSSVNYQPSIAVTAGQQFIICITNWSYATGTVVFQNSGTAQLGCCTAPTITAVSNPTAICIGHSATLTAGGASTYTWSPVNLTGPTIVVSPTASTIYTATGTSTSGCVGTKTVALTVNPSPTITAQATPTSVCLGQSAVLTASGAVTYTWLPGNIIGSSVTFTPIATTVYTVIGTSAGGCTASTTTTITVIPNPTITVNSGTVCLGGGLTLNAGGASTYTWQPGNINASSVTFFPLTTTVYTVTGTSVSGCTASATATITVNPLPVVVPTSNSPICTGGTLNLAVGAATSYTWAGPNGFASNAQNPFINNVTAVNAGNYTVTLTSAQGCTASASTNVIINPTPTIAVSNTGPYCSGSTISLSVSAAASYTWAGPNAFASNAQNPTIVNAQVINAGAYTVTITAVGGCKNTGTTTVIVNPSPTITVNSGTVCLGFGTT